MAKLDDGFVLRGNIWQIRKVIPQELRPYFDDRNPGDKSEPRKEYKKSLRTGDRNRAIEQFRIESVIFDEKIRAARAKLAADTATKPSVEPIAPGRMTPEELRRSILLEDLRNRAELFRQAEDDLDRFWRGKLIAFPPTEITSRFTLNNLTGAPRSTVSRSALDWEGLLSYCIRYQHKLALIAVNQAIARGDVSSMLALAGGDVLGAHALLLTKRDTLEGLAKEGAKPEADLLPIAPASTVPPQPLATPATATIGSVPLLSDAVVSWYEEKERSKRWTDTTRKAHEVAMRHFTDVVGDKPINAYTKADARTFKELLLRLPSNFHKKGPFINLSLQKVAEKAAAMKHKDLMSTATVNGILRKVSSFFSWAIAHYDECHRNPLDKMTDRITVSARSQRNAFDLKQLKTIFHAPLYKGCKSESRLHAAGDIVLRDHGRFWVPLLGLFTGARLGEIVQLHTSDIKEKDGVHYLDLCETVGESDHPKRLKTSSSKREVPLHPQLIEFGFLDFVKARRKGRHVRLFHELVNEADDMLSNKMSKQFGYWLDQTGIEADGDVFHSFRHTFKDACRNSGVPEEISKSLMGHEQEGMSARYGDGFYLKTLAAEVARIGYPGLDLSHLARDTSRLVNEYSASA